MTSNIIYLASVFNKISSCPIILHARATRPFLRKQPSNAHNSQGAYNWNIVTWRYCVARHIKFY